MESKLYKIRYKVENWNKPAEKGGKRVSGSVRVSPSHYGYTDHLFAASIVHQPDGSESVLLLDSETSGIPTRETLILMLETINYYLSLKE